jgi:hypothetical protein
VSATRYGLPEERRRLVELEQRRGLVSADTCVGATWLAGCARARRSRAAQSTSGVERRREARGRRRGSKWLGVVLLASLCLSGRARYRTGGGRRASGRSGPVAATVDAGGVPKQPARIAC